MNYNTDYLKIKLSLNIIIGRRFESCHKLQNNNPFSVSAKRIDIFSGTI